MGDRKMKKIATTLAAVCCTTVITAAQALAVELLVLIAIIAILITSMLGTVARTRAAAEQAVRQKVIPGTEIYQQTGYRLAMNSASVGEASVKCLARAKAELVYYEETDSRDTEARSDHLNRHDSLIKAAYAYHQSQRSFAEQANAYLCYARCFQLVPVCRELSERTNEFRNLLNTSIDDSDDKSSDQGLIDPWR